MPTIRSFVPLICIVLSISCIAAGNKKKQDQFYKQKSFIFPEKSGLSAQQQEQHLHLYEGYVKKRNEIKQQLAVTCYPTAPNITHSPFRSLKIAETFARNGMILHELYFENIGTGTPMGPLTKQAFTKHFGSVEKFKADLLACAGCSRGWVITSYSLDNGSIDNFVLDAHNETVPVLTIPLLVIDIYEHAYMIDFGINRAAYLATLWEHINWNIVEQRIARWIPTSGKE